MIYSNSFQYPVRPSFMTYDSVDIAAGKVKPDQKKVGKSELCHETTWFVTYAKTKAQMISAFVFAT